MLSTRESLLVERHKWSKMKGWKKLFHTNNNQRQAGMSILILDKMNFKSKTVTRDKEGCCLLIKESILQEYMTATYLQINKAPKYMIQMLTG